MDRALCLLAVAALAASGCVKTLPVEDYPCPCAPGWQCCPVSDVCIALGADCPIPSCNCLDHEALIAAVKGLKAKDIFTLVIGFGSAFHNPGAKDVLNQAALAGGMAQAGAETMFYFASSYGDLAAILKQVVPSIGTCVFSLERAPTDPDSLEVILTDTSVEPPDDRTLQRGVDWDYSDDSHAAIAITGAQCLAIQLAAEGRYHLSILDSL